MSYILVTGAAGKLGKEIVKQLLLETKHKLILHDTCVKKISDTIDSIKESDKKRVFLEKVNFLDTKAVVQFAKKINTAYGENLYGIINAVRYSIKKPLTLMTPEEAEVVTTINQLAPMLLIRGLLRSLQARNSGVVINLCPALGKVGAANEIPLAACSGAIESFTRSLALEMRMFGTGGVRVNAVAFGLIEEEMLSQSMEKEFLGSYLNKISAGRFGTMKDIASAVLYLASDESSFVNGTTLYVDGGIMI